MRVTGERNVLHFSFLYCLSDTERAISAAKERRKKWVVEGRSLRKKEERNEIVLEASFFPPFLFFSFLLVGYNKNLCVQGKEEKERLSL